MLSVKLTLNTYRRKQNYDIFYKSHSLYLNFVHVFWTLMRLYKYSNYTEYHVSKIFISESKKQPKSIYYITQYF